MSSPPSTPSPSSSTSLDSEGPPTPPNLHQNSINPDARWLVQKYGGTSIGKFAVRIAEEIVPTYLDQHRLAIVCSARSGSAKATGTTNLLLKAATEALSRPVSAPTSGTQTPLSSFWGKPPNGLTSADSSLSGSRTRSGSNTPSFELASPLTPSFAGSVDLIRSEHLVAVRESINDRNILREIETEIERDCDGLSRFLFAAQVIDEISPRSRDSIVGFGEKLSCKIIAAILRDRGIDSEYVSLENVVPELAGYDSATSNRALDQSFYDAVAKAVGERILACTPRVPVVTGFFGPVPGSLLRQVGRGYTDLLAALLAVGLDASELQIWKEVDGIFTADPRKVPTARLLPLISPEEAAELTYYGSEVVHPFTMEHAIRASVPIRIKNVENPTGSGTVIHPDPATVNSAARTLTPTIEMLADAFAQPAETRKKLPTAVTIKEPILILNVKSNRKNVSHGFLAGIFGALDRFGVVVDLISTSEVHVSMAIEDNLRKGVVERLVAELSKSGDVSVQRDKAILSLVGTQMRHMIGIAGRMFTTLAEGRVNIEMISQGASEINTSCVIDGRDAVKALNLIHQTCLQIKPEGTRGRVGPWLF